MPQERFEKSGPLAGHIRKGRVFRSPLSATDALVLGDWARDDLPDLIWPTLVLSELGTSAFQRFVAWQGDVMRDLVGVVESGVLAACLDGRLSGLERLQAESPSVEKIVRDLALAHGLLSDTVTSAMSSYHYMPAAWLSGADPRPPSQSDIDFIASAITELLGDGHREAVLKCMFIWGAVQAGTFRSDARTIGMLKNYPTNAATRTSTDTAVRAIWNANRQLQKSENADVYATSMAWARMFWGTNSMTTGCVRERDASPQDMAESPVPENSAPGVSPNDPTNTPQEGAHLRQMSLDLLSSYAEALETSVSELHSPAAHEVNAGLVYRAGRDVVAVLGSPDLWCAEHGAHITRMLVEVRIYIEWMSLQDLSIYRRFQDYGAGKAKLYARIMNEIPDSVRNEAFVSGVEELRKLSHNDEILDHRDVDTSDSFSGKSIRAMADDAGLLDMYRQVYSMASGVAHSEWWSVETHAMERCFNILHGGHVIPSLSLSAGGNVDLASAWVDQLYTLMRVSFQVLGTDEAAVSAAFGWLYGASASDGGDSEGFSRESTKTGASGH